MDYKKKVLVYIDSVIKEIQNNNPEQIDSIKRLNSIRDRLLKEKQEEHLFTDFFLIKLIMKIMELSNREKVRLFFDMLEPDTLVINKIALIYNSKLDDRLKAKNVDLNDIYEILIKKITDKQKLELIKQKYPKEAKYILKTAKKYIIDTENRKKGYQMLREHYYERKRLSKEDAEMIQNALHLLMVPDELINFITITIQNDILEREAIRIDRKAQNKAMKLSYDSLNWEFKTKPVLSEVEWRNLISKVKKYYDLDSKMPIKALDIKEKIELVKLLLKLSYKEEEIKAILWQIDEQFPLNNLSNTAKTMRNVSIIRMVIEKAKMQASDNLEIMDTINEILEIKNSSDEKEQQQWTELLLETIDQENREFKSKLQTKYEEVKSINGNQKSQWRRIYLEEIEYEKHSSVILFYVILENLKTCPKEERAIWKQRLLDTLTRMQLECTGNYEYEIEEAKKLERIKDEQ